MSSCEPKSDEDPLAVAPGEKASKRPKVGTTLLGWVIAESDGPAFESGCRPEPPPTAVEVFLRVDTRCSKSSISPPRAEQPINSIGESMPRSFTPARASS